MDKYILFASLFLLLFTSCREKPSPVSKEDNNVEIKDSVVVQISIVEPEPEFDIIRKSIYKSKLTHDSTFVSVYILPGNSTSSVFADTVNRMFVGKFKYINNQIDTIKSVLLSENEWGYFSIDTGSFETLRIKNTPFLYFSYLEGAQGIAVLEKSVYFCLINMNDLSKYELTYIGRSSFKCEDCIEGHFADNPNLAGNRLIFNKLKSLSKNSNLIYQQKSKDKNAYYHLNYETKWNDDNQADNAWGAGYSYIQTPIKSTYYKTDLFRLNQGLVNDSIENDRFILVNYFRGNIIGYDKINQLYFPLLIESCFNFCNKSIAFFDQDSLRIFYDEGGDIEYRISMNDILFDKRKGE